MKIAIICGGLEPGHDGVGDYTRKLAGAVSKQGHTITAIAINDKLIKSTVQYQEDIDGSIVEIARIPSSENENNRFNVLKGILLKFNPDWISLQFVPYSFHAKGLPYRLFNSLKAMKLPYKWHFMFHELWIDDPENKKQYVVKLLQKLIIYTGVKKIKPQIINVTVPYNMQRLKRINLPSTVLGLFGNIVKSEQPITSVDTVSDSKINVLYFGGPPGSEYLEKVLEGLEIFCKSTNKEIDITLVGINSSSKEKFVKVLHQRLDPYAVNIKDLGFLDDSVLSELLTKSTVGIVRYLPYFIGKSGSAVAMIEHGIPVWLPRWNGEGQIDYEFRKELIHHDLKSAVSQKHETYYSLLTDVANQFVNDLNDNK